MKWKPLFSANWEHSEPGLWGAGWMDSVVPSVIEENYREKRDEQCLEGNETLQ